MKVCKMLILVVVFFCLWANAASAAVYVNRDWVQPPGGQPGYWVYSDKTITENTTWMAANSPYILQRNFSVDAGATLTVEAGTTVLVDDLYGIYINNGNLSASNVTFTHSGANYWRGIYLGPASSASSIQNSTISFAGVFNGGYGLNIQPHTYYPTASIYIDSSNPAISGCQISNSETHGIELYSSKAVITSNTFTNMGVGWYPISYDTLDTFAVMSGNGTSGTGLNGLRLPAGSLTATGNWNLPGSSFPYLMTGALTVDPTVTLTVAAGNTIKSNWDGIYINGTLSAVGTASLPIIFTSRSATPAAGDWRGIYLAPTAGASVLTYLTIDSAGVYNGGYGLNVNVHGDYQRASLYLDSISPPLTNVTIQNSQTNGLELYGSNSTITNTTLASCGWSGLKASAGSRPLINNSAINSNGAGGYYAVSLDATSVPDPTNVTFSGNSYQGIQNRGGTLVANATWKKWGVNVPYAVTGDVTVDTGITLSIEPTTTIKLWGIRFHVNGTLNANSSTGRITFTSLADDTIAGDTNGDAGSLTPTAPAVGDWRGIYLAPTAGLSNLTNCDINYAGMYNGGYGQNVFVHGYYPIASIYIDSSNPTISGCQIKNSATHGIEIYSSKAAITSNTFTNMGDGWYPISYDTLDTFAVMSGNSTSGTGFNGLRLPAGSLTVTGNWNLPGSNFPYLMTGPLTVDQTVTLTVAAGNTIKSNWDGIYINGTLSAVGTASLPIIFTSRSATPAAGDWRGIYLAPTAGSSVLTYLTIDSAGAYNGGYGLNVNVHGDYQRASLYLDSISPPLTNVTIQNSQTNGLELYGSNSTIANTTLANSSWSGLKASAGSRPVISNSAINSNGAGGYYAVSLDATSVPNPTNVTFSGNSYQGIQNRGGTLAANATWKKWGVNVPYAVTGDVTVDAGVTLTIEPTTTIKLWGIRFHVNGTLNANSSTGRITFTSLADDTIAGDTNGDAGNPSPTLPLPGDWRGIYLAPTAGLSNLTNCDINYAGMYNGGYGQNVFVHGYYPIASIYIDSSNPTISGCQIKNSATHGIEIYSSKAAITSNTFTNMGDGWYPISYDTLDTFAVMSGNSTSGTGFNGLRLPAGSLTVTGNWNLPGSNFPYLMTGPLTVDQTVTLTVAAGNTIKSNWDGIYINGTLSAVGTASLPITFTSRSATPAAGDWRGIYLGSTAGASALTYLNIDGAGAYNGGYGLNIIVHGGYPITALYLDGISPPLTNVTIKNSQTNGLQLYNSNSNITNSLFSGCGWTQLAATAGSQPTISTTRFIGTSTVSGVTNDTPAQVINARNNYWGASTGPTHLSNPTGTGVTVSNGVDFGSFRPAESFILAVNIVGSGSVYSTPAGITSCSSGVCTAPFNYLQTVTLSAAPAWYTTVLWSGCTVLDNNCSVVMDSDKSVTATFNANANVRLNGHIPTLYPKIMDAYAAIGVSGSGNIQAQTFTFFEDLIFNNPVSVLLEGGRNDSFGATSGYSKVKSIVIKKGNVVINNIVIQ